MKLPDERATTLRSSHAFGTSAKAVSLRYSLLARWPLCLLRELVAVGLLYSTACDAAATRTANPPNGSPLRSACSLDGRSCFHGRAAAGARLVNAEDTMRCSSQRPSCTSSPRTPRATRSSLRSTCTSNPRARPPSNNEHAPLRNERLLPRVEKVSSPPSAATKTRCWSKHEQEEETRRTHRTFSDSRPAACSTRPRRTQPT